MRSCKRLLQISAIGFMIVLFVAAGQILAATSGGEGDSQKPDVFKNLKFRNLGPAVAGGRVTAIAGIPGDPDVYYVGAAAGGVFKTTDGGTTWKAVFKNEATASIGAIALAPSNPNFVWVGTGEANIRNDLIDGRGVYFSPDAGLTWKLMGLADADQISSVLVDPHDSNTVFVGAIGNAWKPNTERGVFRTTDGGKTWKKVFYVDDTTGVADLEMAPGNPKVLFVALWRVRRFPWTLINGGESSGIYRSTDGGDTWQKLTKGLPAGPLGRIALAVAPTNPDHIYALIAAKKGMLWASTDMGDHWKEFNDSHNLDVRPFYFSKLIVSPSDESKVYFLSFKLLESDDGGKTTHPIDKDVHVDHHAIWIDPKNPQRIIQGNDGGVFLSWNGGKTWRFLNNLPIEQFYQVAVDSRDPFTICGGLQDNDAWCGPSTDLGRKGENGWEWYSVVGGDGEYAVPAPSDPDIIYTDSQSGYIERLDKRTHLSRSYRPILENVQETKPADLKYRFNWTSPIAVSPKDANEVYLAGNVVFKSMDGGKHWATISPDLTRNDKSKQIEAGGPVQHDMSGAENYDTIISLTLSPADPKVIWVGTDDGLVQVTRDGGSAWSNVTPNIPGAPEWARVYQVGVSPFDAGTAYVAFDAHMLGDRKPYVYRTSDFGKTWTSITSGLPDDSPAYVVREDPNQRGLLVLGTDTGLFYSLDSGGHWLPLKANFPTVPVWDLKFVKNSRDLVVATHGRGIFVLDDIRPLEEMTPKVADGDFHLFSAGPGTLFHHWESDEDQPTGFRAPNAPPGVVIDYYVKSAIKVTKEQKKKHETPVKITITDEKSRAVATVYGPSKAGVNRFVWNMRYDGPVKLKYEKTPTPTDGYEAGHGPWALAGSYLVAVSVDGHTEQTAAAIRPDPNLKIPAEEFRAAAEAALQARNEASALNEMINQIDFMQNQLDEFEKSVEGSADLEEKYSTLLKQGEELKAKLKQMKDAVYSPDIQHDALEDELHALAGFHSKLAGLAGDLSSRYGEAPGPLYAARMEKLGKELDQHLAGFNQLVKSEVAAYNKEAYKEGTPTLFEGEPLHVKPAPSL
jgi:photosystem II stability/assembly factor-like uncharacterized protein